MTEMHIPAGFGLRYIRVQPRTPPRHRITPPHLDPWMTPLQIPALSLIESPSEGCFLFHLRRRIKTVSGDMSSLRSTLINSADHEGRDGWMWHFQRAVLRQRVCVRQSVCEACLCIHV